MSSSTFRLAREGLFDDGVGVVREGLKVATASPTSAAIRVIHRATMSPVAYNLTS